MSHLSLSTCTGGALGPPTLRLLAAHRRNVLACVFWSVCGVPSAIAGHQVWTAQLPGVFQHLFFVCLPPTPSRKNAYKPFDL